MTYSSGDGVYLYSCSHSDSTASPLDEGLMRHAKKQQDCIISKSLTFPGIEHILTSRSETVATPRTHFLSRSVTRAKCPPWSFKKVSSSDKGVRG